MSSTPKIALPAAKQDIIRRQAKQRRRGPKRGATTQSGYYQGLLADRINQQGVKMLNVLDGRMSSSSPQATEELRMVMVTYVDQFTRDSREHPVQRHEKAKGIALAQLSGSLLDYACRQLNHAFGTTRTKV